MQNITYVKQQWTYSSHLNDNFKVKCRLMDEKFVCFKAKANFNYLIEDIFIKGLF